MSGINLDDIMWQDGSNNTAGLSRLRFIRFQDIEGTLPTVVATNPVTASNLEDLVRVTGTIDLKAGKKPIDFYFTDETGELKFEMQGDLDGKSFKNEIEVFSPGHGKRLLGFMAWVKNSNGVLIAQDKDGQEYLFGSTLSPAKATTATGTTGKAPADRKGVTAMFKFDASYPTPIWEGELIYDGQSDSGS
jgi:hypothetical protein